MKKLFVILLISLFLAATAAPAVIAHRSWGCCDSHTHYHRYIRYSCNCRAGFHYDYDYDYWREDSRYHRLVRNSDYDDGYDEGYYDGYDAGYRKESGENTNSASYNRGYKEGWEEGYEEGSDDAEDGDRYDNTHYYGRSTRPHNRGCRGFHGRWVC